MGGLALFEGVLMRSRTGFAVALRRRNGRIHLRQIPWASFLQKGPWGLPGVRGAASLAEMLWIGTRALDESARGGSGNPPTNREVLLAILGSLAAMLTIFLLLPDLLAYTLLVYTGLGARMGVLAGGDFVEADYPVLHAVLAGGVRVVVVLGYLMVLARDREVFRILQYHGAEHMAVHAYEAGDDVSVEKARTMSRFHPRCGTALVALVLLLAVPVLGAMAALPNMIISEYPDWTWWARLGTRMLALAVGLPLLVAVAFEVQRLATGHAGGWGRAVLAPGLWLQRLTTRQPTDDQLEVALVALLAALDLAPGRREARSWQVRGLEAPADAPVAGRIRRAGTEHPA